MGKFISHFNGNDIAECQNFKSDFTHSARELITLVLDAFYEGFIRGKPAGVCVLKKKDFFNTYIKPLKNKQFWVFAYKLLVHNRTSFAENRIRDIQTLCGDETHTGLRFLLVCQNRFMSQTSYLAMKSWMENGTNSPTKLHAPVALLSSLISLKEDDTSESSC
mgnify:CR=1 FL=1